MSIVTRTGDDGTTGLMYNRRVRKDHPRVEAYGTVDELNAALGVARSQAGGIGRERLARELRGLQEELVLVMGELATVDEDLGRYVRDGFRRVEPAMTVRLEALIRDIEAGKPSFRGWATPGDSPLSAALDVARTLCRRAERRVAGLRDSGDGGDGEIAIYLNRLSDLLWLMAREEETRIGGASPGRSGNEA